MTNDKTSKKVISGCSCHLPSQVSLSYQDLQVFLQFKIKKQDNPP